MCPLSHCSEVALGCSGVSLLRVAPKPPTCVHYHITLELSLQRILVYALTQVGTLWFCCLHVLKWSPSETFLHSSMSLYLKVLTASLGIFLIDSYIDIMSFSLYHCCWRLLILSLCILYHTTVKLPSWKVFTRWAMPLLAKALAMLTPSALAVSHLAGCNPRWLTSGNQ